MKDEHLISCSVGLSYNANLTAEDSKKRLSIKRYVTGETTIRILPDYIPDTKELTSRLPTNSGTRVQSGLSYRGRKRLRQAAQYYQQLVDDNRTKKAYTSFITLTYGKHYPDDALAKKDLDNFLKRMRRYYGTKFHYVWVAERQKRGAIHFHILTPNYLPKNELNTMWNEVVNGRYKKENNQKAIQNLMPNIKAVYTAAPYMSKYISKQGENIVGNGYFVSSLTSDALKPTYESTTRIIDKQVDEVCLVLDSLASHSKAIYNLDNDAIKLRWFSGLSEHVFNEAIKYFLPIDMIKNTTLEPVSLT